MLRIMYTAYGGRNKLCILCIEINYINYVYCVYLKKNGIHSKKKRFELKILFIVKNCIKH